jgi:anti-sigma28 factor (negative regulator of flagellin synthesis)
MKPKHPESTQQAANDLTSQQEWERALENPEAIDALYSPQYLRQCSGPNERLERIAELKRRIESHAYRIDCDRIAEELLGRGDLADS